jgi:hypothetical protein
LSLNPPREGGVTRNRPEKFPVLNPSAKLSKEKDPMKIFWALLLTLLVHISQSKAQQTPSPPNSISCDVLVVGGSLGGVAAAIESVTTGIDTCFIVESGWIGGQMTSQGVTALDEAFWDTSPTYEAIVGKIRDYYLKTYNPKIKTNSADGKLNPGPQETRILDAIKSFGRSEFRQFLSNSWSDFVDSETLLFAPFRPECAVGFS